MIEGWSVHESGLSQLNQFPEEQWFGKVWLFLFVEEGMQAPSQKTLC